VLLKARDFGIDIPDTYILSKKEKLLNFLERQPLITKPCHEVNTPFYHHIPFQNYTSSITNTLINNLEPEFFPTLVQESIDKLFEIRSFYLKGNFYSMAIFSQFSAKTQLDFRNYDFKKPNRTVPFKIPFKLEKKLKKLFTTLDINSGSFDMIFTKDKKYKFLEINPVGQFGMTSLPCNYYLEEIIMQKLINGRYK
jgi:ATP-GRASP peptide maturase of grasp-with-spasm system